MKIYMVGCFTTKPKETIGKSVKNYYFESFEDAKSKLKELKEEMMEQYDLISISNSMTLKRLYNKDKEEEIHLFLITKELILSNRIKDYFDIDISENKSLIKKIIDRFKKL